MLAAFIIGIASAWARGLQIECGCFGGGGTVEDATSKYPWEIARDVGLLLLSGALVIRVCVMFLTIGASEWSIRWSRSDEPVRTNRVVRHERQTHDTPSSRAIWKYSEVRRLRVVFGQRFRSQRPQVRILPGAPLAWPRPGSFYDMPRLASRQRINAGQTPVRMPRGMPRGSLPGSRHGCPCSPGTRRRPARVRAGRPGPSDCAWSCPAVPPRARP